MENTQKKIKIHFIHLINVESLFLAYTAPEHKIHLISTLMLPTIKWGRQEINK